MTIADIKNEINATSAQKVIRQALDRAAADTSHAILQLSTKRALQRARAIDDALTEGLDPGPLAGVPFAVKDNILTLGGQTTAAAKLLENFEAPFQAEAIDKLEAAGAICIGKTNLDAFAHGGSTENSAFGPTTNPHDSTKVAGGSSGGSAASVASGIVPFAIGTDTGGSIRQPASFCGVVGFKPTYGAISRHGVVAMASSTDTVGPFATSVEDTRTVTAIMSGKDTKDSTTIVSPYTKNFEKKIKKVAVIKEWFGDGLSDEVHTAIHRTVDSLKKAGYEVDEISLPTLAYALAVYYIIVPAEISSNLARYDGIRYGVRPSSSSTLEEIYEQTRTKGFMPENKRRILIGNYVLSSGYYDAYFQKAAKVRTLIIEDFDKAFSLYDVLVGPTAPSVAFGLGENTHDPLSMYLADQMTVAANLTGSPAISIPVKSSGLPVGFQIIAKRGDDLRLLDFAEELMNREGI